MLAGTLPPAELEDRGIFATRQLAKRQLTWLRSMAGLREIDCLAPDSTQQVISFARRFLETRER